MYTEPECKYTLKPVNFTPRYMTFSLSLYFEVPAERRFKKGTITWTNEYYGPVNKTILWRWTFQVTWKFSKVLF